MNVVMVRKEIGNLITLDDFEHLDLTKINERVIIPGMVLAHDKDIRRALRRDAKNRLVFRGPDDLTVESERSIYMTPRQVLDREIEAFSGLIEQINDLGSPQLLGSRYLQNEIKDTRDLGRPSLLGYRLENCQRV